MRVPRVLAVDDEREFRDLAVRHFSIAGFDCHAVADAAQALKFATERSPDLIVLDVVLPGTNGYSVLRALRKDPQTATIPIILVSGDATNTEVLDSAWDTMGVAAFVRKPVDWLHMNELVRRTLKVPVTPDDPDLIIRGPLRINVKLRRAFARGVRLKLGNRRFAILLALAQSKDGLLHAISAGLVWGDSGERAIWRVKKTTDRLRNDLRLACGQEMIVSIPGGYKLVS